MRMIGQTLKHSIGGWPQPLCRTAEGQPVSNEEDLYHRSRLRAVSLASGGRL